MNYKISFGTVCMNRLHHLRQTLPKNIKDNAGYADSEFIVLDYNSNDGLKEWIHEEMKEHLVSGKLIYYRTEEPQHFDRSHSRNVLFRLCQGDLLCNVDADNFTGPDFARYLNDQFSQHDNIFIMSDFKDEYVEFKDAYGRFCARRQDFMAIKGYDEAISGYGHEDTDLYERLNRLGLKEIVIKDFNFLHSISHSDEERIGQEFFIKNIQSFYISYSINKSHVLFLYKNDSFEAGTLISDPQYQGSPAVIEGGSWLKGKWETSNDCLILNYRNGNSVKLISKDQGLSYKACVSDCQYHRITNKTFLTNVLLNYSIVTNTSILNTNEKKNKIEGNEEWFGKATVYRNSDYKNPISI